MGWPMKYSEEDFKSGEILLSTAKSEYENEFGRTSVLDSKSNTVFSFASVIFVAVTQMMNIKKMMSVKISCFSDVLLPAALFLLSIGALSCMTAAVLNLIRVIFPEEYKTVDANYFLDSKKLVIEKGLFSATLSRFYIDATLHNKSVNDRRIKRYRRALILITVSILCFAFATIGYGAV